MFVWNSRAAYQFFICYFMTLKHLFTVSISYSMRTTTPAMSTEAMVTVTKPAVSILGNR